MVFSEADSQYLSESNPSPRLGQAPDLEAQALPWAPGPFELPWEQTAFVADDLTQLVIRPSEPMISASEYREQFERQLSRVGVASEQRIRQLEEENQRLRQDLADYTDLYKTCEQELLKSEKARAEIQAKLSRILADPRTPQDSAVDYAELHLKAEALRREVEALARVVRDHPPKRSPGR